MKRKREIKANHKWKRTNKIVVGVVDVADAGGVAGKTKMKLKWYETCVID